MRWVPDELILLALRLTGVKPVLLLRQRLSTDRRSDSDLTLLTTRLRLDLLASSSETSLSPVSLEIGEPLPSREQTSEARMTDPRSC